MCVIVGPTPRDETRSFRRRHRVLEGRRAPSWNAVTRATARRTCSAAAHSVASLSWPTNLVSSVPSQSSITSTSRVSSQNASRRCTTFGWSTFRSTSISCRSSLRRAPFRRAFRSPGVVDPENSTNLAANFFRSFTSTSAFKSESEQLRWSDRFPEAFFRTIATDAKAPAPKRSIVSYTSSNIRPDRSHTISSRKSPGDDRRAGSRVDADDFDEHEPIERRPCFDTDRRPTPPLPHLRRPKLRRRQRHVIDSCRPPSSDMTSVFVETMRFLKSVSNQ